MDKLTTSTIQLKLRKDIKRVIRSPELNEYAAQIGMKITVNRFGNKFYRWSETEYQKLLVLIK